MMKKKGFIILSEGMTLALEAVIFVIVGASVVNMMSGGDGKALNALTAAYSIINDNGAAQDLSIDIPKGYAIVGFSKDTDRVNAVTGGSYISILKPECGSGACLCLCKPMKHEKDAGVYYCNNVRCLPGNAPLPGDVVPCYINCDGNDPKNKGKCNYFCTGGFAFENVLGKSKETQNVHLQTKGTGASKITAGCQWYNVQGDTCISSEMENRLNISSVANLLPNAMNDCKSDQKDVCSCSYWEYNASLSVSKSNTNGYNILFEKNTDGAVAYANDNGPLALIMVGRKFSSVQIGKTLCVYDLSKAPDKAVSEVTKLDISYRANKNPAIKLGSSTVTGEFTFLVDGERDRPALAFVKIPDGRVCLAKHPGVNKVGITSFGDLSSMDTRKPTRLVNGCVTIT